MNVHSLCEMKEEENVILACVVKELKDAILTIFGHSSDSIGTAIPFLRFLKNGIGRPTVIPFLPEKD